MQPSWLWAMVLVALIGLLVGQRAFAETRFKEPEPLGAVDRVQGEARLHRGNQSIVIVVGQPVMQGDALTTAANARASILFKEHTRLTLGENAHAFVSEFVVNPIRRSGLALLDVLKGAFRFTSGQLGQFNDQRIEVRTEAATFAVRDTDFWSGPVEDGYAVLLLSGRIEARNAGGMIILDRRRLGSFIKSQDSPPEMPAPWPKARIKAAVATVAFH
jgi:hypothetical protein